MHTTKLEEYKRNLHLTGFQKEILIGSMLGDGHLSLMPNGKSARLMIEQSYGHKDYVEWLWNIFRFWTNKPPRKVIRKSWNKKYAKYTFQTFSHPELLEVHRCFYLKNKKIVPENIGDMLTKQAFAVWFMDDGSTKSKECNGRLICTHGFTVDEVSRLTFVLSSKFGLICHPRWQTDGTEIYISAKSAGKLFRLLNPFICDSMKYKLPRVT